MTPTTLILTALSVAVGLPRVLGVHSELYQAVAHVWVGALIGCWALTWAMSVSADPWMIKWVIEWGPLLKVGRNRYLWLWVGLGVLEVACFLYYGKQG